MVCREWNNSGEWQSGECKKWTYGLISCNRCRRVSSKSEDILSRGEFEDHGGDEDPILVTDSYQEPRDQWYHEQNIVFRSVRIWQ
jgi:hypothetical protein